MRCEAIIKSGFRAGRKCGRKNCIYHRLSASGEMVSSGLESGMSSVESSSELPPFPETVDPETLPEPTDLTPEDLPDPEDLMPALEYSDTEELEIKDPAEVEKTVEIKVEPVEIKVEPVEIKVEPVEIKVEPVEVNVLEQPAEVEVVETVEVEKTEVKSEQKEQKEKEKEKDSFDEEFEHLHYDPLIEATDILVFDTETTGLPPRSYSLSNLDAWSGCRLVQIAWQRHSAEGKIIAKRALYVRPDGFLIPADATAIHGITNETAAGGIPLAELWTILEAELATVGTLVAHNIEFDDHVIRSELMRSGHPLLSAWSQRKKECTMNLAKVAGLTDTRLKLAVLYDLAIQRPITKALHQADTDTELCADIYFYLREHMLQRYYLDVPFYDKDIVKRLGCTWDPLAHKWYTYDTNRFFRYLMKWFDKLDTHPSAYTNKTKSRMKYLEGVTLLEKDREIAYQLGLNFDPIFGKWYVMLGNPFESYLLRLFR